MTMINQRVAAATAHIAAAFPDLKVNAKLALTALEAKRLAQSLDHALIPSLIAATADASAEGRNVDAMMHHLNELCGVSNALREADAGQPTTLDLGPARTRALRHGLRDILIPAMEARLPDPAHRAYAEIIEGVNAVKAIADRLDAEIDEVVAGLRAKLAETRAESELAA